MDILCSKISIPFVIVFCKFVLIRYNTTDSWTGGNINTLTIQHFFSDYVKYSFTILHLQFNHRSFLLIAYFFDTLDDTGNGSIVNEIFLKSIVRTLSTKLSLSFNVYCILYENCCKIKMLNS